MDEQKLRDYIQQLKNDRAGVRLTVMELESVHIDPFAMDSEPNPDAQRLDLENAVLMQELMAMKVHTIYLTIPLHYHTSYTIVQCCSPHNQINAHPPF